MGRFATSRDRWWILARVLGQAHPGTAAGVEETLARAFAVGARPFEVIAGAPADRHGVRITFTPGRSPEALAAAFGLSSHPWGSPSWVGVRLRADGEIHAKAYHRAPPKSARFELPPGLPAGLEPVMASLDGEASELYLRLGPAITWGAFVADCTSAFGSALGLAHHERPVFSPRPRPSERAFGVSLRWSSGRLTALSLFARGPALPDEESIANAWIAGLDESDARAYTLTRAGVQSLGRLRGGGWHAMLAWTLEEGGVWHRAVSLAVPG